MLSCVFIELEVFSSIMMYGFLVVSWKRLWLFVVVGELVSVVILSVREV